MLQVWWSGYGHFAIQCLTKDLSHYEEEHDGSQDDAKKMNKEPGYEDGDHAK